MQFYFFKFSLLFILFSFSKYPFYNSGLGFSLHLHSHSHQLVQGTNHKWKAKHWYLAGAHFSICVDVSNMLQKFLSIHYFVSQAMSFLGSLCLLLEENFFVLKCVCLIQFFPSRTLWIYHNTRFGISSFPLQRNFLLAAL